MNTYALQVEPDRFRDRDTARLGYREARHIEDLRGRFFSALNESVGELAGE